MERAKAHFEKGDYSECLNAIQEYENLGLRVYNYDKAFARVIPLAIASEQWHFENLAEDERWTYTQHSRETVRYIDLLIKNTTVNDWDLRLFAAQTYVGLYKRSKKEELRKAYDLAVDSLSPLVRIQRSENARYISDISLETVDTSATKEQKTAIEEYNKTLEEQRKTALPPVYEPLLLECEFIFSIKDQIALSEDDKERLDGILYENGEPLFLIPDLDNRYRDETVEDPTSDEDVTFDGEVIKVPASWLSEDAEVIVYVGNGENASKHDEWSIKKVDRKDGTNSAAFMATLECESIKSQKYEDFQIITIEIRANKEIETPVRIIRFKVSKKYIPLIWTEIETDFVRIV